MADEGGGSDLYRLAELLGIESRFTDAWGKERDVPEEVIRKLASALGFPADTDAEAKASIRLYEQRTWKRVVEPVLIARDGADSRPAPVVVPGGSAELRWRLILENGEARDGRERPADLPLDAELEMGGQRLERRLVALPDLPDGYHRLEIECGETRGQTVLIAAPETCYVPSKDQGGRLWGLATQLYSLRSPRNWGMGDFTDLGDLAETAAPLGAGVIGVNPLHALFPGEPGKISPYSPSSRRFLNVLYIDVEAVPDYAECPEAEEKVADPAFQARLARARDSELVDYEAVAACKLPILEMLYRHFRERHLTTSSPRALEFARFRQEGGEGLELFALHEALSDKVRGEQPHIVPWADWPEEMRKPDTATVLEFAETEREAIEFHIYLQWQAALQLAETGRRCEAAGMRIGLYGDLALGVDGASGETWADQGLHAQGASIGAPPDTFNMMGQAWGLPPQRPLALQERAFEPFIALVRANMRNFGALRIDHALGLRRLYWIPEGSDARGGGYVNYPVDDFIAILKLESARNRCMVIGEDLGTVPPDLQDRLRKAGILSYRLLFFERAQDNRFTPPQSYPPLALVAVSTHDLPTLIGYWAGEDIGLREEFGLFPSDEAKANTLRERQQDRENLVLAFAAEGLLPGDFPTKPELSEFQRDALIDAANVFVARTPCTLMLAQAEDILGLREQVNLPGTVNQHPNWRRKLPVDISALAANPHLERLAQAARESVRPAGAAA